MTTRFAQFGLNMGFDVVECFSLQIQKDAKERTTQKTKNRQTNGVAQVRNSG
jgi:hypothetical protein